MLHLYLDGAGHQKPKPPLGDGDTDYYVMAGVLVDDAQRGAFESRLDDLVHRHFPDRDPRSVKIHLSPLIAGDRVWKEVEGPRRGAFVSEMRDLVLETGPLLFGQVVCKPGYHGHFSYLKYKPVEPCAENGLRFLLTRVDKALVRKGCRATVTMDRDSKEMQTAFSNLIRSIRAHGDKIQGTTRKAMSVTRLERCHDPQYVDAQASRCLQVADFVSHFLWRAAEYGQANRIRELDALWDRFGHGRREPLVAFAPPVVTDHLHAPLVKQVGRAGQ